MLNWIIMLNTDLKAEIFIFFRLEIGQAELVPRDSLSLAKMALLLSSLVIDRKRYFCRNKKRTEKRSLNFEPKPEPKTDLNRNRNRNRHQNQNQNKKEH